MTRNDLRLRNIRAAIAAANRLIGPDAAQPSGVPTVRAAPPDQAEDAAEVSPQPTRKSRGRPPSGIRLAARKAGIPEATYRRWLMREGLQGFPTVRAAIDEAPVTLSAAALERISRHAGAAAMLDAVEAEVAARIAPRRPSELDRLRGRVAELEAMNARLRPPAAPNLTVLADK